LSACLSAVLLIALADSGPASAGSRGYDSRRASDSYRAGSRLHYIRRDDRRRALSGFNAERPSRHSESSTTLGGMPCRTMTSVDTVDGRRALVSQRECIDASGITHVSPGSRRVVRFYDE
jgi:hypothetical protein